VLSLFDDSFILAIGQAAPRKKDVDNKKESRAGVVPCMYIRLRIFSCAYIVLYDSQIPVQVQMVTVGEAWCFERLLVVNEELHLSVHVCATAKLLLNTSESHTIMLCSTRSRPRVTSSSAACDRCPSPSFLSCFVRAKSVAPRHLFFLCSRVF
jgi:hypothetical protein